MLTQPRLDPVATATAVAYLASRIAQSSYYMLGHLLYLADKRHLEEYGRTITGERYHALPHGPVPSDTYACLQAIAGVEPGKDTVHARLTAALSKLLEHVGGNDFRVRQEPDLSQLSESDVDCLDEIIVEYGDDIDRVHDATHDEAYKKMWKLAQEMNRNSLAIPVAEIVSTLRDAELLKEYLADPHPGD